MDFVTYLQNRHSTHGGKEIGEISAKQYNNRLDNMMKYGIYNGEPSITPQIIQAINQKYANSAGEYERTIKYYLEYKATK